MMEQTNLAILLATYNSERYLKEQLDSLFSQTYNAFTLYIRDDGSNDKTREIVDKYREQYPNIVWMDDPQRGRKAMGSFIWLLENVNADYYMFCDHDDVWFDTKVEKSLHKIMEIERQKPNKAVVVNTDLRIVDQELRIINNSMWKYEKINREILSTFDYLAVCNAFTGCTMILNHKAKEISLPISSKALMHDFWIALKVAAHNDGILGYVDEPTINYRQHSNNVVGSKGFSNLYVIQKLQNIKNLIQSNIKTLNMVREVGEYSLPKYIKYKILYFRKR